ncbi:4'-phosphopantetheinyl transferase family protein [Streptomyces sp. NPDC057695]|uniref:4'-phosphopantetheinyl transferase family protein n=1 Tax=unclassified Streptomyces TaxID=2593676 RepID=UPI003636BF8D
MTDGPDRGGDAALAVVATTPEVLAHPELDEGLLAPWERRRLDRIRLPGRRADVLAARLLVRLCVTRATGLPLDTPALAQLCPGCGGEGHGRPYLRGRPGTGVSLSHADGLVAAAAGPGPVGIDVEPATRRPGPAHVLRRLLPEAGLAEGAAEGTAEGGTAPPDGPELLRLWVRAEARLKAGGGRGAERDGPGGLRLLEWTDRPRAAVAAVAATTGVAITSV